MNKNRLEAFSDGVLAIIITIMVLEMKAPHVTTSWSPKVAQAIYVFVALLWLVPDKRIERWGGW